MKRIRGGSDVWWWDEQPIYEATHRRAIAAGKRRMRRDDVVRSGQDWLPVMLVAGGIGLVVAGVWGLMWWWRNRFWW